MTEMSIEALSLVTVQLFIDAYNRNIRKAYEQFAANEFEWREGPTSWFPQGRSGGRREALESVSLRERLLKDESLEIESSVVSANTVALEGVWRATVAKDSARGRAGTKLEARLAMFLRVKNAKITSSHEYVCTATVAAQKRKAAGAIVGTEN